MILYKLQNMNRMIWKLNFSGLLMVLLISSCTRKTAYERYKATVEKELAGGQQADSLFFGIHLGMTSKEFYGHSWDMNKNGLFTDGENNTAILYNLNNGELSHPASMNFYPSFYNDSIHQMSVSFQYDSWAPWNRHLFADSLQSDVFQMYKKWYSGGNPFISMDDEKRGVIYVKVDGNRRIIIGKFDDSTVKVDYADLIVEKEMKRDDEKK